MAALETAPCGRCRTVRPLHLLDTVLLDEHGARTSDAAYCVACFPAVQRVSWDRWRAGDPVCLASAAQVSP